MRKSVNFRISSGLCVMVSGTPAADPSALTATPISATRIDGTYTPSATAGATHTLGYSSNGGASYTTVTVTGGTYSITGLTPRTAYQIRLQASTIWGDSAFVGPVGASTPDVPPSLYPALDFTDARNSMYQGAGIV